LYLICTVCALTVSNFFTVPLIDRPISWTSELLTFIGKAWLSRTTSVKHQFFFLISNSGSNIIIFPLHYLPRYLQKLLLIENFTNQSSLHQMDYITCPVSHLRISYSTHTVQVVMTPLACYHVQSVWGTVGLRLQQTTAITETWMRTEPFIDEEMYSTRSVQQAH